MHYAYDFNYSIHLDAMPNKSNLTSEQPFFSLALR